MLKWRNRKFKIYVEMKKSVSIPEGGERLKIDLAKLLYEMTNKGYSAKRLAEKAGVSEVTISRIRNGKSNANTETIWKLATALECDITDIIQQTD